MKKKVKLFTTIASLCLAVSLMAFGVYAATTAKLGVNSTVQYTVSDQVHVKFDIKAQYTTGAVTANMDSATTGSTDANDAGATLTGKAWSFTQAPADDDINKTGGNVINLGAYTFNVPELGVKTNKVVYTIKITNLGNYDAKVAYSNVPTAVASGKSILTAVTGASAATGEAEILKKGSADSKDVFTLEVTYTLDDPTTDCAAITFNPSFEVTVKNS